MNRYMFLYAYYVSKVGNPIFLSLSSLPPLSLSLSILISLCVCTDGFDYLPESEVVDKRL